MITQRYRRWLLSAAVLIMVVLLSGCGADAATTQSSWPGLAASEDTIYMAFGPSVYAIDPESGDTEWTFPEEPVRNQNFYAPPAIAEDLVVVDTYNGWVFGLDPDSGSEKWSFKNPEGARFVAGATIGEDKVYVGSVFGTMFALDRETGDEVWHYSTQRDIWSAPLLTEDTLYFVTLDRHLYAVDIESGELQWQFPSNDVEPEESTVGPMVGTPTLVGDTLFFGDFRNEAHALSLEDRDLLWTYDTQNWIWGSLVYSEETATLIGADLDGNVFSLDAETGDEVWLFSEPTEPVVSTPVISEHDGNPAVFVTSGDSNLYILDLETGEKLDSLTVTDEFEQRFLFIPTGTDERAIAVYAPAVFINNLILLASHESPQHPLMAFDRETLDLEWKFDPTAE